MNIIIAGDGEVGFYLARSLTDLDHNITVVDPHSELLKRLEKETDLLTIAGSSTSPQVLADAKPFPMGGAPSPAIAVTLTTSGPIVISPQKLRPPPQPMPEAFKPPLAMTVPPRMLI